MATPCNKSKDLAVSTARLTRTSKVAPVTRDIQIRGSRSVRSISQNSSSSASDQVLRHQGIMDSPSTDSGLELTKTGRIRKAKKGKKVHNCPMCQRIYSRNEHLQRHVAIHKPSQHVCAECSKEFSRPDLLKRHQMQPKNNSCKPSLARAHSASAALKSNDSLGAKPTAIPPTQTTIGHPDQEEEVGIKEEERTTTSFPHAIMTKYPHVYGIERLSSEECSSASDTARDNYVLQQGLHHSQPQDDFPDHGAFHTYGTPYNVCPDSYFALSTSPYHAVTSLNADPMGYLAEPRQLPPTPADHYSTSSSPRLHVASTSPPYDPNSAYASSCNTPHTGSYSHPPPLQYLFE